MKQTLHEAIGLPHDAWLRVNAGTGRIERNINNEWSQTSWRVNLVTSEVEFFSGVVYEATGFNYSEATDCVVSSSKFSSPKDSNSKLLISSVFESVFLIKVVSLGRRFWKSKNRLFTLGLVAIALAVIGFQKNERIDPVPVWPIAMAIVATLIGIYLVWRRSSLKGVMLFVAASMASRAMWFSRIIDLIGGQTQGDIALDTSVITRVNSPNGKSNSNSLTTVEELLRETNTKLHFDSLLKKIRAEYNADSGITIWAVDDMELLEVPSRCEKVEGDGSFSPEGTAVFFGRAKLNTKRASVIAFYMGDDNEPHPGALEELPEKIIKILSANEKIRSRPEIDGCWIDPVKWLDESNLLISANAVSQGSGGFEVNNVQYIWNVRTNECVYNEAFKSKDESLVFNDVPDIPAVPFSVDRSAEEVEPENAMTNQVKEELPEPVPRVEVSRYSGQVGNLKAQFVLNWLPKNEVEGIYWHPARNPSLKYRIHGLNTGEGKMILNEYTNDVVTAQITLLKNDKNGTITWSGIMENTDGRKLNVSFSKDR